MSRRFVRAIAPFLVGVCIVPVNLAAQSPTTVAVHARLMAGKFRLRFNDGVPEVEAALARQFAAYLAPRVGYLRFAPGDTSSSYRVVFDLDKRERGSMAAFEEFGFWARLEGTPDAPLELYWLQFRPADQSSAGVGTQSEFLATVEAKLAHADPSPLRDSLFKRVPITQQALPNSRPPGWALTFRHLDLCIRNSSKLEFVNEMAENAMLIEERLPAEVVSQFQVPPPPAPAVEPFVGGVFSKVVDQNTASKLTQAMMAGPVRVKAVFVVVPQHDANACRDRGLGAGGQR